MINQVLSIISIFFTCTSILSFCLNTVPDWRVPRIYNRPVLNGPNMTMTWEPDMSTMAVHDSFIYIDCLCNLWFSLELIARLVCCPNRKRFFMRISNLVDIIATMSFYYDLVIYVINLHNQILFQHLGIIRLIRILQLYKLTRHSQSMKILIQTFRASAQELLLLALFLGLFSVFFASLIYYVERLQDNQNNQFDSILVGLWWALVTMTTVGYGDVVPKTPSGMIVGLLTL